MALSIQSLRSEVLIGAQEVINAQSNRFPLLARFPRKSYDGEELEIRVRRAEVRVGKYTGSDGAAYLVRPGQLQRIRVTPLYTRPMHRFSNADLNLFRRWDQVLMSGGAMGTEVALEAGDRLAEIVEEVSAEGREAIHDMLVGALLGEFTYEIGGVEMTVDYGHNDVSAGIIGTVWTDAAATIITDMHEILDEFKANSGGVRADTAYYSSRAWAAYFVGNTQFQTFIGADPMLARAFAGIREGLDVVDAEGRFIDPLFGLEWIPVDGPHTLQDGTVEDRWPTQSIVLTSERQDTKKLFEHSMVRDEYTPDAMWAWETFRSDEPKGVFARYADNGAASIMIPERVQIIDCEPIL